LLFSEQEEAEGTEGRLKHEGLLCQKVEQEIAEETEEEAGDRSLEINGHGRISYTLKVEFVERERE